MQKIKKLFATLMVVLTIFSIFSMNTSVLAANIKVKKIKLNDTSITMYVSEKETLKPTISPSNATNKKVSWSSSNKKIVTVSSKGELKAIGKGTAYITCKAKDGSGKYTKCKVTVTKKVNVTKITLNTTKKTIVTGASYTLKSTISPSNASVKSVKWSTSNKKVATVSSKGVIKGIGVGTAYIYCKATDGSGKYTRCKITVKQGITKISLNTTAKSIYTGKTYTLTPTVSPSKAYNKNVKWSSENTKIATVTSNGVVKGISAGTTYIVCKAADGSGKYVKCKIVVKPKISVESINLSVTPNISPLYIGETVKFTATVNPSNATFKTVTYTSSNPNVLTINSKGEATAKNIGKAIVTATADGKKTTFEINVIDMKLETEIFDNDEFFVVGNQTGLETSSNFPNIMKEKGIVYEVKNNDIIKLVPISSDPSGSKVLIEFIAPGTTSIRAHTTDGRVTGNWIDICIKELYIEDDYFDSVKTGDVITLNSYVLTDKTTQEQTYYHLEDKFKDDIKLVENQVTILRQINPKGVYVTVSDVSGRLNKKIYFMPQKFEIKTDDKKELIKYAQDYINNSTLSLNVKTVKYSNTTVNNHDIKLSSPDVFLNALLKAFEDDFKKELSGEGPDTIVKNMFNGQETFHSYTGPNKASISPDIVKDIKVNDNGQNTFDIIITLNSQTKTKVQNTNQSTYAKLMPVINTDSVNRIEKLIRNDIIISAGSSNTSVSPIKYDSIYVTYSSGSIILTIDKYTNKLVEAEYNSVATVNVNNSKLSMTMSEKGIGDMVMDIVVDMFATFNTTVNTNIVYK